MYKCIYLYAPKLFVVASLIILMRKKFLNDALTLYYRTIIVPFLGGGCLLLSRQ